MIPLTLTPHCGIACHPEDVRALWSTHGAMGSSTRSTRFKPSFLETKKSKKKKNPPHDPDEEVRGESMQLNLMEVKYLAGKGVVAAEGRAEPATERYRAYETFREAGWIPKSGAQYGTDFVLYAMDPDRCHSRYCVTMMCGKKKQRTLTLMRQMRVAEQTRKRLVYCDKEGRAVQYKRWVLKHEASEASLKKGEETLERRKMHVREKANGAAKAAELIQLENEEEGGGDEDDLANLES